MPKAPLIKEDEILVSQIMQTMYAGLSNFRPDLHNPESASDMEACIRAVIQMFEVKRRPLFEKLRYKCDDCEGLGHFIQKDGVTHFD